MSENFNIYNSLRIKILIVLVTILLIVLMFPKGESIESETTIGSIWIQDDLIASTTFPILKNTEVYENEMQQAANAVIPIFYLDDSVSVQVKDSLIEYSQKLKNFIYDDVEVRTQRHSQKTFLSQSAYLTFLNLAKEENSLALETDKSLADVFRVANTIVDSIYNKGMLNLTKSEIEKDSIALRTGKYERLIPKSNFFDINSVSKFLDNYLSRRFSSSFNLNSAVAEFIFHFVEPNYIFNKNVTEEAKNIAMDKVSPNIGIVNENERIVGKHDRITPEIKLKIDSYRIAKAEETGFWGIFSQNLGKFLHVIIIFSLISIYIYLFRQGIFRDNLKILLIAIIILFISFLTFLVFQINVQAPVEFLILVPVASMLLTIIFDSRIGFYGTITVALIAGGLRGNDYVFTVMHIIAGAFAAYTVRDIKNRSQIFRSFLFILLAYIVSIIAFGLERFDSAQQILINSGFAASNALISPVLTYGLIIFFERIFKITTDLTLLELTDFNSPLLKELARNAPGTFNHSLTIGSMVENAAEAIDANPLLARVGAYYHDIGKSLDPEIFVENQLSNENLHERLDPKESAQMIIEHVRRGIELGEKHNLPKEIVDFIPMHHGTLLVSFFYEKAKEKYGEDNVNIEDFRYPGPKPDSKEAALVMLADASESAVRSMTEPDPQKVENMVNNLIDSRIEDGQLDEAPVTLNDIKIIKETFHKILLGQHHKRIRYPKQEEIEETTKK